MIINAQKGQAVAKRKGDTVDRKRQKNHFAFAEFLGLPQKPNS